MPSWVAPDINDRPVAVVGAGVLGRRIACSWAAGGYHVNIRDPSKDQRNAALHYLENNLRDVAMTLGTSDRKPGKYTATEDLDLAVANAWLVIEAVPEKLELKIEIFGDIANKAPNDSILGSNSSSYKSRMLIDSVSAEAKKRCLNVHYTMPPGIRIVELMTSTYTDETIFSFLVAKHKDIGLLPAVCRRESTGFIMNRLWASVKRETLKILAEGVSDPHGIDVLWTEMFAKTKAGPCAMMDAVGLDTVAFIEDHYIQELHLDGTNTVDFLRRNYLDKGRLGAKSGQGGLYPAGYTTKIRGNDASNHDNLAAPTLYILDIGVGENTTNDYYHAGSILVASPDGKALRQLIGGLEAPDGIDISISDNRIFWTNMGIPTQNNGTVQSAKLDGTDFKTVIEKGAVHTPKQITIDQVNHKMYLCDREGLRVHRANLDGTQHEVLVQTGDYTNPSHQKDQKRWCVGVCVDIKNGKFYWSQKGSSKAGEGRIFRANTDMPPGEKASTRTDIELIFENLPEPIDLEIDDDEVLYWTDRGEYPLGNSINRGKVSGNNHSFEILTRHLHEAIGIRIDKINKHIYFADLGGTIYRTDMDGKGKQKLFNAESAFAGLALAHVNS